MISRFSRDNMGRRLLRSFGRSLRSLRRHVPTATKAATAYAASRSLTRTRNKKSRETRPLTYDNDFKTDYRYRRMPRRRRRRWVKFVKRVNAVVNRGMGLKKLTFQDLTRIQSLDGFTNGFSALLYTPDAQVNSLSADLGTIFRNILGATAYDNINTFVDGDVDKKIRFESASMDITWRNIGSNPVIIDLYYVRARKTFGLTSSDGANNCHGIYNLGFTKQGQIVDEEDNALVGSVKSSAIDLGTTPFQSSLFCQTYKVLSKKRITIAPGNTVSMTLKDSGNRVVNATDTRARICMRGLTHGYFFQQYGVPGLVGTTLTQALPTDVVFTCQKRYAFYLPVSGKDQTATTAL